MTSIVNKNALALGLAGIFAAGVLLFAGAAHAQAISGSLNTAVVANTSNWGGNWGGWGNGWGGGWGGNGGGWGNGWGGGWGGYGNNCWIWYWNGWSWVMYDACGYYGGWGWY